MSNDTNKKAFTLTVILLIIASAFLFPLAKADTIEISPAAIIVMNTGEAFCIQDFQHSITFSFTIVTGSLIGNITLSLTNTGSTMTILPLNSTSGSLSISFTPNYPLAFQIKVNGVAYTSAFSFTNNQAFTISWIYPAVLPSASPVPPYFPNSINTGTLWQYLNNYDFIGFIIACWTMNLGQSFFVILALIVSVAIYIRYQNLIAIGIMWLVLGSVFIVWVPIVAPFIIFAFVIGIGSILYKVLGESKP